MYKWLMLAFAAASAFLAWKVYQASKTGSVTGAAKPCNCDDTKPKFPLSLSTVTTDFGMGEKKGFI